MRGLTVNQTGTVDLSGGFVNKPIPGCTITLKTPLPLQAVIHLDVVIRSTDAAQQIATITYTLDDVETFTHRRSATITAGGRTTLSLHRILNLTAGPHTIIACVRGAGLATLTADIPQGALTVLLQKTSEPGPLAESREVTLT